MAVTRITELRVRAEAIGVMNTPFNQHTTLSTSRNAHVQMTAATPRCAPSTESKKSNVAISRKPISCFTRNIHGPGFGRNLSQAGIALNRKYGYLILSAIDENNSIITPADRSTHNHSHDQRHH